ncbi:hypothetical protein DFQ28_010468 [Apophysomyces sp. BC1034]|nr:hypothetical protein DFQ28_010468 [Apophysomyces sp. BC1034]
MLAGGRGSASSLRETASTRCCAQNSTVAFLQNPRPCQGPTRSTSMSLLPPEQIAAAQKANLETLFGLTNKAFEGVEKLVELNRQVVKSTLAELHENAQRALSVKDAQELLSLQASLTQPVAEKVLSYGRLRNGEKGHEAGG